MIETKENTNAYSVAVREERFTEEYVGCNRQSWSCSDVELKWAGQNWTLAQCQAYLDTQEKSSLGDPTWFYTNDGRTLVSTISIRNEEPNDAGWYTVDQFIDRYVITQEQDLDEVDF